MELSGLTIKLIMILIPGAICTLIIERLTIHKNWTPLKFIVNVILLGSLSYLIYQLFITIPFWITGDPRDQKILDVWLQLTDKKEIPFDEVILGSVISIILGFISSAFIQYKILNKIAQGLRISDKYGDENLYTYFLNSPVTDEVYLRDKENGITYHGIVDSFSENDHNKEIVLTNVTVYHSKTSTELYDLEKIYISSLNDNITIEVPFKQ
ncbi:MAG: hypothetical protein ACOCT9_00735 [archaeon]